MVILNTFNYDYMYYDLRLHSIHLIMIIYCMAYGLRPYSDKNQAGGGGNTILL